VVEAENPALVRCGPIFHSEVESGECANAETCYDQHSGCYHCSEDYGYVVNDRGRGAGQRVPAIVVQPDPDNPGTVLLHPDDLSQFRRRLEKELDAIEALRSRKEQVEERLGELDAAERELEKRSGES